MACSPVKKIDEAQYWQRTSASEAAYLQGPKVQQMLNLDISRCVTELRELERIGVIENAIPVDRSGSLRDPDAEDIRRLGTVERYGYLRAEDRPYHDFETCMHAKGWQRIKYVPYDRVDRAQNDYLSTLGERARKKVTSEASKTTANNRNDYDLNN